MRAHDAGYRRLVRPETLLGEVLEDIRKSWSRDGLRHATAVDLDAFEQRLDVWLQSFKGIRTHFVPCAIIEGTAKPFSIGPVRFVHIDLFDPAEFGIEKWESASSPLLKCMAQHNAKWIGIVEVNDCEAARSEEIADLAVDLALSALQTQLPDYDARNIARSTGRAIVPLRGSLVLDEDGHWNAMWTPLQPGFLLNAEDFNKLIERADFDLHMMGEHIEAFRTGISRFPMLQQAWCDAALWYHEGFSEPLDTIAVAKLETAIENLFAAGSATGSKATLLLAFKYVFHMERDDVIDATLPVTVEQFVRSVVTARSRILHGTWSTLVRHDLEVERRDVVKFARTLLIYYPRWLGGYVSNSESPTDSIQALLKWVDRRYARRISGQ